MATASQCQVERCKCFTGATATKCRRLVLGEVVAVHIDRELLVDGIYETAAARPILRAGKLGDYAEIEPAAMFTMQRPTGTK